MNLTGMLDLAFPLDDSYIALHNARVLMAGHDPNYGVSALIGATSSAHLVLLVLLGLLLPLTVASFLANSLALLVYAVGLWRLALLAQPSRWVAVAIVALGLGAAHAPYHLFNGLETGMAMAAVVWALVLAIENSRAALPLLCGLMPFIRPELAALSASLILWRAWRTPRILLTDLPLAAVSAAPWAAWIWLETGRLIPATASAKQAFFAESQAPLVWKVRMALGALKESWIGLVILGALILKGAPAGVPARAFVLASLTAFTIALPGGLAHNSFRYLYPFVPVVLLFVAFAAKDRFFRRVALPGLLLGSAALTSFTWATAIEGREFSRRELTAMDWARTHLPADARILVHDAGYAAWATPFRLVDVVGLKTPSSVAAHQKWTAPTLGRERHRAIAAIAAEHRPTHAIILNEGYWSQIASDLRKAGWSLHPLRQPALRGYSIYELATP